MSEEMRLIREIANVGRSNRSHPPIGEINIFQPYFKLDGNIDYKKLDLLYGSCTGRELLSRYLLLCAVIDQGPDIVGVRRLLIDVTNSLYKKGVNFLHRPLSFFERLTVVIDEILKSHDSVKKARAAKWAKENHSSPGRYNLFLENTKQVLNYTVFRWGVPLTLPLLLEEDCGDEEGKHTLLLDYLESWPSAEAMSHRIKDHERYGLGKAIGDKACHLFAKWVVSSFHLTRIVDNAWGDFSFEVPYDSNAGRVLWRTGFFLRWASEKAFVEREVIQRKSGKGGLDYIRVTNIRGMPALNRLPDGVMEKYGEVSVNHLKTHKKPPKKVEIQRIQHAYLLGDFERTGYGVADFDEGLIHLGTRFCFNHEAPLCDDCPIRNLCEGKKDRRNLIENYRT